MSTNDIRPSVPAVPPELSDDGEDYRTVREKFEAGEYGGLWGWAASIAPIPEDDAAALAALENM